MEVLDRSAQAQCLANEDAVAVGVALVAVEVVGRRVDDGETSLVVAAPDVFGQRVIGVYEADVAETLSLKHHHSIFERSCVAILENQRATIGRGLSRHDDGCASRHFLDIQAKDYQQQ